MKISPDLERNELFRICETALELGVDGIVACNTTIQREAIGVSSPHPGGLSGRPLTIRARELIRDIHTHTRGKIRLSASAESPRPRMRGCYPRRRIAGRALHGAHLRRAGGSGKNQFRSVRLAPPQRLSFHRRSSRNKSIGQSNGF